MILGALTGCTVIHSSTIKPGSTSGPNLTQSLSQEPQVNLRKQFAESPQDTNNYWNQDRLNNARPIGETGGGGSSTAVPDEATNEKIDPTTGPIVNATTLKPVTDGQVWSKVGLSGRTNGRLYFEVSGQTASCSATVVNSLSHSLVATAGHCVINVEGSGEWADHFMFVPADANMATSAPFGKWFATEAYAPQKFQKEARASSSGEAHGDAWSNDFAFLRMAPNNGIRIQDALGGQGIFFGQPQNLTVIGYPAEQPFDGKSERFCAADAATTGLFNDYEISCTMNQGASGGAWLTNFDSKTGAGYLVSVTSVGGEGMMNGAHLGKIAANLYHQADTGS